MAASDPRARGGLAVIAALVVAALVVLAVSASSATSASPPPATTTPDLTTFGYGNARLGDGPAQPGLSASTAGSLKTAWRTNVGGAVNTQPLVAHGVDVDGRARDLVYVGTEHGEIVALDAETGVVVWRRTVAVRTIQGPCAASPDSEFGVTGTMVLDRGTGRLYAVDVTGHVWALALGTGSTVPGWPVGVQTTSSEFVWSALTLSRGWLYVPIASVCDSGFYHGGVVAVDVKAPSRIRRWRTTGGTAAYAGGIWGWGGVSVDDRTGNVFAATGNSLGTANEDTGDAERVVRLSPTLSLEQSNGPLHGTYVLGDRDFGTTPVLFHAAGCPAQLVAINKVGSLYVYDQGRISAGPVQSLTVAAELSPTGVPLYGVPAYDQGSRTLVLVSPTTPPKSRLRAGLQAFRLAKNCRFVLRWQRSFDPPDAGGPPTIAGGVIYIGTGRDGWLRAYRLADGHELWSQRLASEAVFAAPSVVDGTVFEGDWTGHVWAFRPRP